LGGRPQAGPARFGGVTEPPPESPLQQLVTSFQTRLDSGFFFIPTARSYLLPICGPRHPASTRHLIAPAHAMSIPFSICRFPCPLSVDPGPRTQHIPTAHATSRRAMSTGSKDDQPPATRRDHLRLSAPTAGSARDIFCAAWDRQQAWRGLQQAAFGRQASEHSHHGRLRMVRASQVWRQCTDV
jgi:hypothetical protein